MVVGRVKFVILLFSVGLACSVPPLLADKKDKDKDKDKDRLPAGASNHMSDQRRSSHALNRLTFGPRPGDVQRVMAIGVDHWIDRQLHPDKIDDSALNARLEPFRTTRMSTEDLAKNFPDGQEINQIMNGKRAMPSDPALRMIYQVQIARQEERKQRQQEAGKNANAASNRVSVADSAISKMPRGTN